MRNISPIQLARIREIPLREALEFYGLTFNGHSFALCPFHAEDTPSFLCRAKDARWKCFGCGESGDLIEFVSKAHGLNFPQTVEKICRDWHLDGARPTLAEIRANDEAKIRMARRKRERRHAEDAYLDALDDWLTCTQKTRLAKDCDPLGAYAARLYWDEIKARYALEEAEQTRAAVQYEPPNHTDFAATARGKVASEAQDRPETKARIQAATTAAQNPSNPARQRVAAGTARARRGGEKE